MRFVPFLAKWADHNQFDLPATAFSFYYGVAIRKSVTRVLSKTIISNPLPPF